MNILITGAYGFVGTNLINNLKIKHNLYGLDIVCPTREGVLKTFCWKDIDPESFPLQTLPQFDAIIHLAGKAHDTKNQSAAQSYFDINTGLTQKIFDFFLESSAKKFIFFSNHFDSDISVRIEVKANHRTSRSGRYGCPASRQPHSFPSDHR